MSLLELTSPPPLAPERQTVGANFWGNARRRVDVPGKSPALSDMLANDSLEPEPHRPRIQPLNRGNVTTDSDAPRPTRRLVQTEVRDPTNLDFVPPPGKRHSHLPKPQFNVCEQNNKPEQMRRTLSERAKEQRASGIFAEILAEDKPPYPREARGKARVAGRDGLAHGNSKEMPIETLIGHKTRLREDGPTPFALDNDPAPPRAKAGKHSVPAMPRERPAAEQVARERREGRATQRVSDALTWQERVISEETKEVQHLPDIPLGSTGPPKRGANPKAAGQRTQSRSRKR